MLEMFSCPIVFISLISTCLSIPVTPQCAATNQQGVTAVYRRSPGPADGNHPPSNMTVGAQTRQYKVDLTPWDEDIHSISTSYLRGFFAKELRTHVRDAIALYGSTEVLPVREWYVRTEEATSAMFREPKFQVTCAPSADDGSRLPLTIIRDFFNDAPDWITNEKDWQDSTYKTIVVEVLDESPDGGESKSIAKCSIDAFTALAQWTNDEIVINETILPSASVSRSNSTLTSIAASKRDVNTDPDPCAHTIPTQKPNNSGGSSDARKFEFKLSNPPRKPPPSITSTYLRGFTSKVLTNFLAPNISTLGANYIIPNGRYFMEVPAPELDGLPKFYVHLYAARPNSTSFTLDLVRDFYTRAADEIVQTRGWDDEKWRSIDVDILEKTGEGGHFEKTAWGFLHAVGDTSRWSNDDVEMMVFGKGVGFETDMSNITSLFETARM